VPDTQTGETPLKGGLGVNVVDKGESFPDFSELRESLEGVGILAKGVGADCLEVVNWMGEGNLLANNPSCSGKGRRLMNFIDGSELKTKGVSNKKKDVLAT